jgi:hypothetical protein
VRVNPGTFATRLPRDASVNLHLYPFQDDTLVVALGITVQGEKVLMGFVETGTGDNAPCSSPSNTSASSSADQGSRVACLSSR